MPHIPRNSASTTGVPPELIPAPKQSHTPIPLPQKPQQGTASTRTKISLGKLSPHTYEPDHQHIVDCLLGKETHVDPNTGQLVLTKQPAANKTT